MSGLRELVQEIHRRSLWQVLAIYVGGSWLVFEVVQTLTEGLGLPGWFPSFALVLLLVGLPIVLATAFVQEGGPTVRRHDPTLTPRRSESPSAGSASVETRPGEIRRLFTWRNAILGGLLASALWGFAAAGWLIFGGPGFLLRAAAADFVGEGDRVIVAEIENRTDQPDLGLAVREALITDLAQSERVNVVESSELRDVLERMRLPDTTAITDAVALEVARREGYPAMVTGSVARVGAGYQLTARIVEAATGESVVRQRETAADETEIIPSIENLSRSLRRHLGESLTSVRRSPPLPKVTTESLEALELLARARERGRRAEYAEAIALAKQAVELDSAFAGAYSALAVYHNNIARPELANHYSDLAYQHAERLPAAERLGKTADYHSRRGRPDSAVYYLELLVELDPERSGAFHSLGNVYSGMGRHEEALQFYRGALELNPDGIVPHYSFTQKARRLGYDQQADSVLALMEERFPDALFTHIARVARELYLRNLERVDSLATEMRSHPHQAIRAWGELFELFSAGMHGKLDHTLQAADSLSQVVPLDPGAPSPAVITAAWLRMAIAAALAAGEPARALQTLETAEPRLMGRSGRASLIGLAMLARGYALAGESDRASRVLALVDSSIDSDDLRIGSGHDVSAVIALREGRPQDVLDQLGQARSLRFGGLGDPMSQFVWAEANAALGKYEEAAAAYDSLLSAIPGWGYDTFYLGPLWGLAHERLGSIYLSLGDTTSALRHLSTFVELWKDADADLQPRVEAARRTLRRLAPERTADP